MVRLATLKHLSAQKFKDALVLHLNNRSSGSIYMVGYSLEFMLKRKISLTLNFSNEFPETASELNSYANQLNNFNTLHTGAQLVQISQIRNHKLNELLIFSGVESRIKNHYLNDWKRILPWNPENRYKRHRYTKNQTGDFIRSAKVILQQIS